MKYQVELQPDVALRLEFGFAGKLKVYVNDEKLEKKNGSYHVKVDNEIKLLGIRRQAFTGTPIVQFNGREIEAARRLKGYEWFLSAVPLILIFFGGALGGFAGVVGMLINKRLFRSKLPVAVKIPLSLLGWAASAGIYLLFVLIYILFTEEV